MTQLNTSSSTAANSIADCGRPIWDMARRDYEAGQTAGAVCAHYGLTESALRSRAHRHDWKRAEPEVPDQSLLDLQAAARDAAEADDDEPLEFEDMIEQAWNHFERALAAGRSAEAARWFKLTEALEARRDRLARKAEEDALIAMFDRADAINATNATTKSNVRTTSPFAKANGEDRPRSGQEGASPARPVPTETLQQIHARRRAEAARSNAGAAIATNAIAKPTNPATSPSGGPALRLSPPFAFANGGVVAGPGAINATSATAVSAGVLALAALQSCGAAFGPDPTA